MQSAQALLYLLYPFSLVLVASLKNRIGVAGSAFIETITKKPGIEDNSLNNNQKKTIKTSQITAAGAACVMVFSYSPAMANPSIPDTDDTTWRYQSASQPGWGNLVGSCDTSSTSIYGREAAANAFGDPALAGYVDAVDAPPVPGHSHFTSCGTWLGGEAADGTITGLTAGETYQGR